MMSMVFRLEGATGAVAGGLFLVLGHLLNYTGGLPAGTTAGKTLVFAGHVVLVFAFVGLYSHQQRHRSTSVGRAGMILGVLGTVMVSAIVFVELAGTTGVDTTPVFEAAGTTGFYTVGPLVFVLGMVLVGGSIVRRADLPRLAGGLLVVGTAVFAGASAVAEMAALLTVIGAAVTAAGFIWLGAALLTSDTNQASVGSV